ncbi:stage V sporulation protein AF [Pelagirhabdus alkalitolerans]|uniref:Stage V sporulation protein AF n=1 Tax=Pelagirhabdus alkalitolerans TaxID=1612202 RepID=A0A1G6HBR2_9BACI|nr:stage V sporulation protein AF [Pelagirhabdus alkalitolerans]
MTSYNKQPVFRNLDSVKRFMEEEVGVGKSFDAEYRELIIHDTRVHMYYVNGLCETQVIVEVLELLIQTDELERSDIPIEDLIRNRIAHQQFEESTDLDKIVTDMLSGLMAIFIEGYDKVMIIDVRSYPGRGPEEPDTERVVRGSRDGYTENIIENTALTRRRIRDHRLRNEMIQVGNRSKTDLCITYIKDLADPKLLQLVKDKLEAIDIEGLSMTDKTIEEFIVHQGFNPFPLVRYTERPDVASDHLFEGHIILMIDTSPSMVIIPISYFHHLQHAEEYRQAPAIGSFVRLVRFIGIFVSLFLLPFWYLLATNDQFLPDMLHFIGPEDEGNVPLLVQIVLADLGVEFLRMAAIHTPNPLSTAMGLIAAVLIGEIAIEVGLFTPEVILYVSLCAIGTYATPSYELSVANKMSRLFFMLSTALFGLPGLVISATIYFIGLINTHALRVPYFWPLIPFNFKALLQILIRYKMPSEQTRPSITSPKQRNR